MSAWVAVAALVGLGGGQSSPSAKPLADAVRHPVVTIVEATAISWNTSRSALGWTALTLMFFLWIGRRFPLAIRASIELRPPVATMGETIAHHTHMRRQCVSFRMGGRNGP